jgi:hypothetical protein
MDVYGNHYLKRVIVALAEALPRRAGISIAYLHDRNGGKVIKSKVLREPGHGEVEHRSDDGGADSSGAVGLRRPDQ